MGTFIGHVIPGVFLMLLGAWWMTMLFRSLLKCHHSSSISQFRSSFSMTPTLTRWRLDPMGGFGVFSAVVGLMVELRGAYLPTVTVQPHHLQHATMYFFFGLMGALVMFRTKLQRILPFLDSLLYAVLAMAFATEGLLFQYHIFGRDDLDVAVHQLLVLTTYLCTASALLESWRRDSVMPVMARAFFIFLQGTWFCQVGFILYNPVPGHEHAWDPTDHHHIMLVACIYTWHIVVILVATVLLAVIVFGCCRSTKEAAADDYNLLPINGYTKLLVEGDTDIRD